MGAPQLDEKEAELVVKNLKVLRQTMNWTQQDLANRVGVTRQTITAIESGKKKPSKTLALAILGIFVSVSTVPIGVVIKAILESTKLSNLWKKIIEGDD